MLSRRVQIEAMTMLTSPIRPHLLVHRVGPRLITIEISEAPSPKKRACKIPRANQGTGPRYKVSQLIKDSQNDAPATVPTKKAVQKERPRRDHRRRNTPTKANGQKFVAGKAPCKANPATTARISANQKLRRFIRPPWSTQQCHVALDLRLCGLFFGDHQK